MPMNSDQVLGYLNEIADVSSRSIKESMVKVGLEDPLFRAVVIAAYDPFVTYGVTGFDAPHEGVGTFMSLPPFLTELSARRLTGNAAAAELTRWACHQTLATQELVRRIVIKDLRAGFTEGTCNRVEKGVIPVFSVMLAHAFEEKRIKKWPVGVEPKLDGVRVGCVVSSHTVEGVAFLSRNGKPFPAVEHLKPAVLDFLAQAGVTDPYFLDGEMLTGSFNKTVGDVRRKSVAAVDAEFHVFDGMRLSDFKGGATTGFETRRARVEALFAAQHGAQIPIKLGKLDFAHTIDEVMALYVGYRAQGLEGAIVKPLDAPYVQKRSHGWAKVKPEETEDLRVVSVFEGEGKFVGKLGGLVVDFKGVEVRVGGGFSDAQRDELWRDLMTETVGASKVIGRLMEVEFHEVTPDGSLRHPRFVRWRDDKDMTLARAA